MLVLGIETSCDDTSAAILENGIKLRANVVSSQDQIHMLYGGIVPELASRAHIECIDLIIEQALKEAGITLNVIDLIAVTKGPGLVGSLLVGLNTAKGIAYAMKKTIIGINHLEGHLLAIFLEQKISFPYLALIVSGGHTDLCRVDDFGKYHLFGRTRDDAAGESFDKVAKMLGQGYPGGPIIEKMAQSGNPNAYSFPRSFLDKGDFSFSGLKTAVRTLIKKRENGNTEKISDNDIAACFQEAVVDVLVKKLVDTANRENLSRVVVTGGVAANQNLRSHVNIAARENNIQAFFPDPQFCTDNAAMIACAGHYRFLTGSEKVKDYLHLDAVANLSL